MREVKVASRNVKVRSYCKGRARKQVSRDCFGYIVSGTNRGTITDKGEVKKLMEYSCRTVK